MPVPQQVLDLIERFTNNLEAYRSGRYDCRIRPVKTDNAATARVMYLRYTDLPQHKTIPQGCEYADCRGDALG